MKASRPLFAENIGGATFDAARVYRWTLWREWGAGSRILWVMLNPSTADEHVLDPTIRRCVGFSRLWGHASIEVCNLFALRSTDPRALRRHADPVGAENDAAILAAAGRASQIIVAWGRHGALLERAAQVERLFGGRLLEALRVNADGSPEHPLYVPGATVPRPLGVLRREIGAGAPKGAAAVPW